MRLIVKSLRVVVGSVINVAVKEAYYINIDIYYKLLIMSSINATCFGACGLSSGIKM